MNIYDEALNNIMNTLCQRQMDLLAEGTITVDEYDTIMKPLFDSNKLLKQALERAKKEHELLGLKDKHISHFQSLYASMITNDSKLIDKWSAEIRKVQSDIWKLEKELEEMK